MMTPHPNAPKEESTTIEMEELYIQCKVELSFFVGSLNAILYVIGDHCVVDWEELFKDDSVHDGFDMVGMTV